MSHEVEVRLTPLDKEIIDKLKSEGIKVNLSRPKMSSLKTLTTVPITKPCNQCNGCLISKCKTCPLCITTAGQSCSKQKCEQINSYENTTAGIVSTQPHGNHNDTINDLNSINDRCRNEIGHITDEFLEEENRSVPIETEDHKNDEIKSVPKSVMLTKGGSNMIEPEKNSDIIDAPSIERLNSNALLPDKPVEPSFPPSKLQTVLSSDLNSDAPVTAQAKNLNTYEIDKDDSRVNISIDTGHDINPKKTDQVGPCLGQENGLIDSGIQSVTVQELDNALLKENSQTENFKNSLNMEGDEGLPIPQNTIQNFQSKVKNAEMEIHDIVGRTARVNLTSSNLNLSMAKNMLKQLQSDKGYFYSPAVKTEHVQRILLSYFYFVRLKDKESCQQLQGKLNYWMFLCMEQ